MSGTTPAPRTSYRTWTCYHITNSLYDNVMSARIAARDLAAMLWMPHVMSMLCMLHVMLMLCVHHVMGTFVLFFIVFILKP